MSETFRDYQESYPPSIYAPPLPPPPSTGATAGTPGTWTPDPSTPPANAAGAGAVVASPATDWTVGQYVQGSTAGAAGEMNWNGTAWVAGRSAVTDEPPADEGDGVLVVLAPVDELPVEDVTPTAGNGGGKRRAK